MIPQYDASRTEPLKIILKCLFISASNHPPVPHHDPQADKAVIARVGSVASHAAAFLTELEECKTAITDLHSRSATSHTELTNQFNAALLPLKQFLGLTGAAAGSASPLHGQSCNKRTRADSPAQPAVALTPAVQPTIQPAVTLTPIQRVIMVTSNQLSDVLDQMADSSTPAIYDFMGRCMQSNGRRDVKLVSDGVTWRNGKIVLPSPKLDRGAGGSSLLVSGKGVVFESITVTGGQAGVKLVSGGSLRMTGCEIRNANFALRLEDHASLVATNLTVCRSASCAAFLQGSSTATLIDCDISESEYDGICLRDSSSLYGTRMHVQGCGDNMISMWETSLMRLSDSTAKCGFGQPGTVNNDARLFMARSDVDGGLITSSTAAVRVEH